MLYKIGFFNKISYYYDLNNKEILYNNKILGVLKPIFHDKILEALSYPIHRIQIMGTPKNIVLVETIIIRTYMSMSTLHQNKYHNILL